MKFMFKKIFLFLSLFFLFGFFVPASAADVPPTQNPTCWSKDACQARIEANGWDFKEDLNWLSGGPNGECGGMGACIPAGKAQLSIKIGGADSLVSNLGDYIKTIYIYLIGIGGIVAVILILKGGLEYISSAGSPERVSTAKSTITSALIGLFLLLGSYTMLYTINPDLLKLKLPRVFMLRAISLGTDWCKDQPAGAQLALAKATPSDKEREISDYKQDDFKIPAQPKPEAVKTAQEGGGTIDPILLPICGATYFSNAGSAGTCNGHVCKLDTNGKVNVCVKKNNKYSCVLGRLSGEITGNGLVYPFINRSLRLMAFCNGWPLPREVASTSAEDLEKDKRQNYFFTFEIETAQAMLKDCVKGGFYLVGKFHETGGIDDDYAVGMDNGVCNVNLHTKIGYNGGYDEAKMQVEMVAKVDTILPYLITLKQLEDGLICDMPLSRSIFPAL